MKIQKASFAEELHIDNVWIVLPAQSSNINHVYMHSDSLILKCVNLSKPSLMFPCVEIFWRYR